MSNRSSKLQQQILLPGTLDWELWTATATSGLTLAQSFEHTPGAFNSSTAKRILGLPASSVWVLPAWLKGDASQLRDMAQLHLERLSVRTPGHEESLSVESLDEFDGANLTRIVALKDVPTPLTDFRILPDECRLSAQCYNLAPDRITIWRELGRLVAAITVGPRLAYFSPMSSATMDQNGIAELNNICLQLSFQKVLTQLTGITLWIDEGDADRIAAATGLEVSRHDKPIPRLLSSSATTLMPADVILTRQSASTSAKRRVMMLAAGFILAGFVAAFSVVMGNATKERDALREKIAALTPKSSKVASQKAAWMEGAPANDFNFSPMELLLRLREPQSAGDIALMSFECTGDSILLRGFTEEISPALKFTEDVKNSESLSSYQWESTTPKIENGVTFELKGTLPQPEQKS